MSSLDVEKGTSETMQVQDSCVVKIMACVSALLLLLVVAVVALEMFFNARPVKGATQTNMHYF